MTDDFEFDQKLDDSRSSGDSFERAKANFDTQVKKKIRQLNAKNPDKRREAAYWLGESGEPQAITALVTVYKKDKDKSVREAAKYALGMFRSLDNALSGSEAEQDRALELVENIVTKGKMGSRAAVPPGTLAKVEFGLLGLLVLLVVLNLAAPTIKNAISGGANTQATEVVVADIPTQSANIEPIAAIDEIRTRLDQIRSDANKLQIQFGKVSAGNPLDCDTEFANPLPYTLPQDIQANYPDIVDLTNRLNAARLDLVTAKTIFDQGCQDGTPTPLTQDDIAAPLETVTNLLRNLSSFDAPLEAAAASVSITPTAPPDTPTPTATATDIPSPTPTATISPSVINNHLIGLDFILEEMTNVRGANKLLLTYWTDVLTAGVTDGCRPPFPTIPDNYPALDEQTAEAFPKLQEAVEQVNLGLDLSRQGWTLFTDACNRNNLSAQANTGSQFATTADQAFAVAVTLLDEVRVQIRS